jgi:nitrogen fixation protein NifB
MHYIQPHADQKNWRPVSFFIKKDKPAFLIISGVKSSEISYSCQLFREEVLMQNILTPQNRLQMDPILKVHPCLDAGAHAQYGRIHLPVSPSCNIQCKFCKRSFNKCENRPGVTRSIITPLEAVELIAKALQLCPEIRVAGIAGPGDPLATDHALETIKLIDKRFPELLKCMSTNGLQLESKAEQIASVGVKTITVTVNAVNPDILKKICSHVLYRGRLLSGTEAAETLLNIQLAGIKKITDLGLFVKINTVLIPGINDRHISEIAKITSRLGAALINVIPLIPQNEMQAINAPSCEQLSAARSVAENYLAVFRHCQQCRADACGIPGSGVDLADTLYDYRPVLTFSHG